MKHIPHKTWIKQLEVHRDRVGIERDRLRETMAEMEGLSENCERAAENLQSAIDALSELA